MQRYNNTLADGSTFCVMKSTKNSTTYFNVAYDIDGPDKGNNADGSDIFYASITFNPSDLNAPGLEPFLQTDSLSTQQSLITSGSTPSATNGLLWIMTYDNMEYNNCSVTWVTKTMCN